MKRRALLAAFMCAALLLLGGCGGGQEIESCLFVIAMAVDPAPQGNVTLTVKALSGSQDAGAPRSAPQDAQETASGLEETESGYITLSATAPSCLRALELLSATTPRTLNLSQLQEIVLSETLARSGAALSVLREIYAMYRANGAAAVVVTPDDAGDFIRRQHALLGVRLSQYLSVLFDHFSGMDTIPPDARLAAVIAGMESSTGDAAAVYAAGNTFESTLVLEDTAQTNRLPGHLPRTSPAHNEYLGAAVFSGAAMTGTLTGSETALLCLMQGRAQTRTAVIGGAQYKTNVRTRVRRSLEGGALQVSIRMNLTRIAGSGGESGAEIAAQIERDCVNLIRKLQALSCDALGFGTLAVRGYADIPAWESSLWRQTYEGMDARVQASVRVL